MILDNFRIVLEENTQHLISKESIIYKLISIIIPNELKSLAHLSPTKYFVKGSVGQGNSSEIHWIMISDPKITKSAQKGYYIVFLFQADKKGFYISLNQGYTQYKKKYRREAKIKIREAAIQFQNKLRSTLEDFSFDKIDLKGRKSLAKGYELGHICGKYYDKTNFQNESDFINDLNNLLGVYRELKGLIGLDIFNQISNDDDEEYQNESNNVPPLTLPSGPIPRPNIVSSNRICYERDPAIAKISLINSGYKCEIDPNHKTFENKSTHIEFMEAHHLVPMKVQDHFEYSLDVPENICSLCPICHRAIHHAVRNIKLDLIKKLFIIKNLEMRNRGIIISVEDLITVYDNDIFL